MPNSMRKGETTSVIVRDDSVTVNADIVRSIPIFYTHRDGGYLITDNPHASESGKLKEDQMIPFLAFGYTLDKETMLEEVFQIQAGEILEFTDIGPHSRTENCYPSGEKDFATPYIELKKTWRRILDNVFVELVQSLGGKPVVVMLSGGYDSRLIASLLRAHGKTDVTCVSYGVQGNSESHVAREVARRLGYRFIFVEYTPQKWSDLIFSERLDEYVHFSHRYASLPHLQELIATWELRDAIRKDTVIVPGHAGDFLGGSHVDTTVVRARTLENVIDALPHILYLRSGKIPDAIRHDVLGYMAKAKTLLNLRRLDDEALVSLFEFFDWRERQSKFIVNSVRVYEHYGYAWALPFWDIRIVDFWSKVPSVYRYGKKLYDEVAREVFDQFNLNFDLRGKARFQRKKKMKEKIQHLLRNGQLYHQAFKFYMRVSDKEADPALMGRMCPMILNRASKNHLDMVKMLLAKNNMTSRGYHPNCHISEFVATRIMDELGETRP